jgi:purine-binding chemotaxis protein CheW
MPTHAALSERGHTSPELEELHTLVVFTLEGRAFALPVLDIGEILRMVAITHVPDTPAWVRGVINLRGQVIPVVDLRRRLGLQSSEIGLNTPILVVRTAERSLGLIADAVTDVIEVPDHDLSEPSDVGGRGQAISAVVRTDEGLVMILDLDEIVSAAGELHVPEPDGTAG